DAPAELRSRARSKEDRGARAGDSADHESENKTVCIVLRASRHDGFSCAATLRAAAAKRCSEQYSARTTHPDIVVAMAYCAYCDEWAVIAIPTNPSPVCLEHAVEFWTGL